MKLRQAVKNRIQADMLANLRSLGRYEETNLHLLDRVLQAGEEVKSLGLKQRLERDTALVLADLAPRCNWAHPCQYHLHDAASGEHYATLDASFPPMEMKRQPRRIQTLHRPVLRADRVRRHGGESPHRAPANRLANHPGQRYAILYSGDSDNRHVNDLEFLYRTLLDIYGFDAENIHVLNHDGTLNYDGNPKPIGNWPGDDTPYRMEINGQGTRAALQTTLDTLADQLRPEDLLLIHTNNHGAGPGDGSLTDYCLCAYDAANDWSAYMVDDFIDDLERLPDFEVLMVMMEQCRSGGFIDPILAASPARWTHVVTAVHANDYSLGDTNFDPFAEDWIAALAGGYADGTALSQTVDANLDGRLSSAEAYTYADDVHEYDGRIYRYHGTTPLRFGDTPQSSDAPADRAPFIFLGQPDHDLFLRDNLHDHGREPLVEGGISCSPDIVIYNDELLDPEATLLTPSAQDDDTLGQPIEAGQDNFVYLRVQNRGTEPTAGRAKIYWCRPSVLPAPASWNLLGETEIPAVPPEEMIAVGPLRWDAAEIPGRGHYCFVGLIESGEDPAPDRESIHTYEDFRHFIRESNNATWKNFDVVDLFANSVARFPFQIQGWPREALEADLELDLSELPPRLSAELRLVRRLSEPARLEGMDLAERGTLYDKLCVQCGRKAYLRGMPLRPSDNTQAKLQIVVPEGIPDGAFRLNMALRVNGQEMGRVTRMLAIGDHPYLANRRTHELHVSSCQWASAVSYRNRVAYRDLDRALGHGYDGCYYCLPEHNTD